MNRPRGLGAVVWRTGYLVGYYTHKIRWHLRRAWAKARR